MEVKCYNCKYVSPRYETKAQGIFPFNSESLYRSFVCTKNPPTGNGFPNVASYDKCVDYSENSYRSIEEREIKEKMWR